MRQVSRCPWSVVPIGAILTLAFLLLGGGLCPAEDESELPPDSPRLSERVLSGEVPPELVAKKAYELGQPAYTQEEYDAMPVLSAAEGPVLPTEVPVRILTSGGREVVFLGLRPDLAEPVAERNHQALPPMVTPEEMSDMTEALVHDLGQDPDGPAPWSDPSWQGRVEAWHKATGEMCGVGPSSVAARTPAGQRRLRELQARNSDRADSNRAAMAARGESPMPPYVVRVAYLIPSDLDPKPIEWLQSGLLGVQWFFRDQMERAGYGAKTFHFETEADNITPKIHVVHVPFSSAHLNTGVLWIADNIDHPDLTWFADQELWIGIVANSYQLPNGRIEGAGSPQTGVHSVVYSGSVTGNTSGMAGLSDVTVSLMNSKFAWDDEPYVGRTIPELGPLPLAEEAFPLSYGNTLEDLHWWAIWVFSHEIGHAFSLSHYIDASDDRMPYPPDTINSMYFSSIGGRSGGGNRAPLKRPDRYAFIWPGHLAILNTSRWFDPYGVFTDNTPPQLETHLEVDCEEPLHQARRIRARFSDDSALAAVSSSTYYTNYSTADWAPLDGVLDEATLSGSIGLEDHFIIYDSQGNFSIFNQDDDYRVVCPSPDTGGTLIGIRLYLETFPYSVIQGTGGVVDPTRWMSWGSTAGLDFQVSYDWEDDGEPDVGPLPVEPFSFAIVDKGKLAITGLYADPESGSLLSDPVYQRVVSKPMSGSMAQ